jgi:hypothetical protein
MKFDHERGCEMTDAEIVALIAAAASLIVAILPGNEARKNSLEIKKSKDAAVSLLSVAIEREELGAVASASFCQVQSAISRSYEARG